MIQSSTIRALPSVGPLLGAAYDRGITTLVRSWRVVLILLVAGCLIASVPGLAQSNSGNLLFFVWNFYAMANAIRVVFDPEYRMTNRSAGDMFATQLITVITVVLLNFMAVVALMRAGQHDLTWLLAVPGIVAGIWVYVRWVCAPALAAQGIPTIKALGDSWHLTSTAFWPTLVLPCANVVVGLAIGLGIGGGARVLLAYQAPGVLATAIPIAAAAVLYVGQLYATQSYDLAICMWLNALRESQPAEPPAAI